MSTAPHINAINASLILNNQNIDSQIHIDGMGWTEIPQTDLGENAYFTSPFSTGIPRAVRIHGQSVSVSKFLPPTSPSTSTSFSVLLLCAVVSPGSIFSETPVLIDHIQEGGPILGAIQPKSDVAHRVGVIIEKYGLPKTIMASALSVSRPTLYDWINGKVSSPHPSQLNKIERLEMLLDKLPEDVVSNIGLWRNRRVGPKRMILSDAIIDSAINAEELAKWTIDSFGKWRERVSLKLPEKRTNDYLSETASFTFNDEE